MDKQQGKNKRDEAKSDRTVIIKEDEDEEEAFATLMDRYPLAIEAREKQAREKQKRQAAQQASAGGEKAVMKKAKLADPQEKPSFTDAAAMLAAAPIQVPRRLKEEEDNEVKLTSGAVDTEAAAPPTSEDYSSDEWINNKADEHPHNAAITAGRKKREKLDLEAAQLAAGIKASWHQSNKVALEAAQLLHRPPPAERRDKPCLGFYPPFPQGDNSGQVAHGGCRDWDTLYHMYDSFLSTAEGHPFVMHRGTFGGPSWGVQAARVYVTALLVYGLTGSADPSGKTCVAYIPAFSNPHLQFLAKAFFRRCMTLRKYIWPHHGPLYVESFLKESKYVEHFRDLLKVTKNMNQRHAGKVVHPNSNGMGIHPEMQRYYHAINIFWEYVEPNPPHDYAAGPWKEDKTDSSE